MVTKLLRDPVWQFVSAIIAIVAIFVGAAVSYNMFLLSENKRQLQINLVSSIELIDVVDRAIEGLEVSYVGTPTKRLSIINLEVKNTGTGEIRSEDFISPLRFVFPQGTVIADVTTNSVPPNVDTGLIVMGNTFTLRSGLLNPNDAIAIQVILLDAPAPLDLTNFYVEGRVAGVQQITITDPTGETPNSLAHWLDSVLYNQFIFPIIIAILLAGLFIQGAYTAKLEQGNSPNLSGRYIRLWIIAISIGILLKIIIDRFIGVWYSLRYPYG